MGGREDFTQEHANIRNLSHHCAVPLPNTYKIDNVMHKGQLVPGGDSKKATGKSAFNQMVSKEAWIHCSLSQRH